VTGRLGRGLRARLVAAAGPVACAAVLGWLAWVAWAVATGRAFRPGWVGVFAVVVVAAALLVAWAGSERRRAIRETPLPRGVRRRVAAAEPGWSAKDLDLVERGFRQFFLACARSGRRRVAMPSRAVDAYWHAFLLDTRAYAGWCARTLGRFLHHVPAERMGDDAAVNDALRRCWVHACREESIDPRRPTRLPLLFALDAKLGVAGGIAYVPSRRLADGTVAASTGTEWSSGSDFGDDGVPGDADGMGGADAGGGDGGDGGGGCGGD
jgi:hypothetical protein